jgi:hypothetical protein
MTMPDERTQALVRTHQLLLSLQSPQKTPRVPRWLREEAKTLLRHYPTYSDIKQAHEALPYLIGPVQPFNRFSGTTEQLRVVDAPTKDES